MDDLKAHRRAILLASLSLLGFSAFTGIALAAWFARAENPLGWKSVVAMVSVAFGVTTAALVWRAPSRNHVFAGIGVMVFSLLRIGSPSDWTWASYALVALTTLLLIPLVHAVIILPPPDE